MELYKQKKIVSGTITFYGGENIEQETIRTNKTPKNS